MHVNVVSTSSFLNLHEECSILSRELENGAQGVIVQLTGDDIDGLFPVLFSGADGIDTKRRRSEITFYDGYAGFL